MGIKGLWQALREYVDDGHLSQFRGQRVAVDMYVWLHRCIHRSVRINDDAVLAYLDAKCSNVNTHNSDESNCMSTLSQDHSPLDASSCNGIVVKKERVNGVASAAAAATAASSVCLNDKVTPQDCPLPLVEDVLVLDDQFITLVVDKVSALQRFGVTPICVFDGDEMPMKGNTDEERQRRRQDAYVEAMSRLEQLYCEERRRRGWVASSSPSFSAHHAHHDSATSSTAGMDLGAQPHPHQQQQKRVTLPHTSRLYEEAVQLMEKAVDISTELAHAVIQILREERNVECIVAPYEADAQLAYLCREGYVSAAASEDSDLIAYYCPCIISKLDTFTGKCEVLQPAVCAPQFFHSIASPASPSSNGRGQVNGQNGSSSISYNNNSKGNTNSGGGRSVHHRLRAGAGQSLPHSPQSPFSDSFNGGCSGHSSGVDDPAHGGSAAAATTTSAFTYESFLLGCIMAGCDYVANLRNIGIKKAFKLVAHASSLRQVFALLESEYGFPADELASYRRRLLEAFYCFAHHLVYSPLRQEIVPYHPLPVGTGNSDGSTGGSLMSAAALKTQLVGSVWEKAVAQDVCARCLCDPCTLRLYRGTYQSCVTRYLQRTRRGQTSLKSYAGFAELTSNKVVVHLSGGAVRTAGPADRRGGGGGGTSVAAGVKRERANGVVDDNDTPSVKAPPQSTESPAHDFGAPLEKKQKASGFLGTAGSTSGHCTVKSESPSASEVVVVRSRYFLVRGRTAVREAWSASEEDEEEKDDEELSKDVLTTGERFSKRSGKDTEGSGEAGEGRQTAAKTSDHSDFFALHAARPRAAAAAAGGAGTPIALGLARPPPPPSLQPSHVSCHPRASSPPSNFSTTKAASGLTDDATSGAEAATLVENITKGNDKVDTLNSDDGAKEHRDKFHDSSADHFDSNQTASSRQDSSAEDVLARKSSGWKDSATTHSAAASGTTFDFPRDSATLDSCPAEESTEASTHARVRRPCLTETPDVEPYAYPISEERPTTATAPVHLGNTEGCEALSSLSSPALPCACPFGYWQCNRAHSVFESCFLGKQWSRDDKPHPMPPASLSPVTAAPSVTAVLSSSTPTSPAMLDGVRTKSALATTAMTTALPPLRETPSRADGNGGLGGSNPASPGSGHSSTHDDSATGSGRVEPQRYTPRGFRPPRSTAFPSSPPAEEEKDAVTCVAAPASSAWLTAVGAEASKEVAESAQGTTQEWAASEKSLPAVKDRLNASSALSIETRAVTADSLTSSSSLKGGVAGADLPREVLQSRSMNKADAGLTAEGRGGTKEGTVSAGLKSKTTVTSSASQLPSHRAAVRMAIFDQMAFKKPS